MTTVAKDAVLFSTGCSIRTVTHTHDNSDGVILFISDGLGESSDVILHNPAIEKFAGKFSAVFFDNRGTGESTYPLAGLIGEDEMADDLKCVLNYTKQAFPNQPVTIFAASFAAIPALTFLSRNPAAVDKLILDSPVLLPTNPPLLDELMTHWKKNAKRLLSAGAAGIIHDYPANAQSLNDFLHTAEMVEFIASNTPVKPGTESISFYYAMRELMPNCDLRSALGALQCETLLLLGQRDRLCPPDMALAAAAINNNVCSTTFSGLTHRVYNQSSDEFARICTEFCLG